MLTPLRRGVLGVLNLNQHLQEKLNPQHNKREFARGETVFREGDRVLQTVNNYDRMVYNGDIGRLVKVNPGNQVFTVQFEQGPVDYDFAERDELDLAYALTVHKSQGDNPAVVLVLHSSQYIMLQRNLFYTALTRAQKMVCIVGDKKAIFYKAINTVTGSERYTRLGLRLRGLGNYNRENWERNRPRPNTLGLLPFLVTSCLCGHSSSPDIRCAYRRGPHPWQKPAAGLNGARGERKGKT